MNYGISGIFIFISLFLYDNDIISCILYNPFDNLALRCYQYDWKRQMTKKHELYKSVWKSKALYFYKRRIELHEFYPIQASR